MSVRPFESGYCRAASLPSELMTNVAQNDNSRRYRFDSNRKAITATWTPRPKLDRFKAPRYLIAGTLALQLAGTTGFEGTAWTGERYAGAERSALRVWGLRGRCRVCERPTKFGHVTDTRKRVRVTVAARAAVATAAAAAADAEGSGGNGKGQGTVTTTAGNSGTVSGKDYYSILGLAVGASPADIKDAYRRLVVKVHPDSDPCDNARGKFEEYTAAYGVLSDPGKRSTYDQGMAMRRFVDRVKAGNWAKTLEAVANLGVVATSVGVSVGVAAAQPLAKDLARGLADVAAIGMQAVTEESDTFAREQQAVLRTKAEAERKLAVFRRKAEEAVAEALSNEEAKEAHLKQQQAWNATLTENKQDTINAQRLLEEMGTMVTVAVELLNDGKATEQETAEALRRSKAAREAFAQASSTSKRRLSTAEAGVTTAEHRLAEALKALDNARLVLESAARQDAELDGQRGQVLSEEASAEHALHAAKQRSLGLKSDLAERQTQLALMQAELKAKTKQQSLAAAKVKELGDAADTAGTRAFRLRKSAKEYETAAMHEAQAVEAATRQEARLKAEAAAAKATLAAAAAAAQEEQMQREREKAAAEAQAAVVRARLADEAAEAAAAAAIAAAEAAKQATADAAAAAEEAERRRQLPPVTITVPRTTQTTTVATEVEKGEASKPQLGISAPDQNACEGSEVPGIPGFPCVPVVVDDSAGPDRSHAGEGSVAVSSAISSGSSGVVPRKTYVREAPQVTRLVARGKAGASGTSAEIDGAEAPESDVAVDSTSAMQDAAIDAISTATSEKPLVERSSWAKGMVAMRRERKRNVP